MHLLLAGADGEANLNAELRGISALKVHAANALLLECDFGLTHDSRAPYLAFCRQLLPNAVRQHCPSINGWASLLFHRILQEIPENGPWCLHIVAHYAGRPAARMGARAWHSARTQTRSIGPLSKGANAESLKAAGAGQHRAELIKEAVVELLRKNRRYLLRALQQDCIPFSQEHSLVQLLLTSPDSGYVSVAPAPLPFVQRHLISPFPKGEIPVRSDKQAPSRAFAKLVEALDRAGRRIAQRETCVDLGAAPGSWTYVAVNAGARVIAVDRARLREDLMANSNIEFVAGDAFGFSPKRAVDWLICDVIAPAEQTVELLLRWLRNAWCRNFVVTIKMQDQSGISTLSRLKECGPALAQDFYLTHLCANKKEVCAFGSTQLTN